MPLEDKYVNPSTEESLKYFRDLKNVLDTAKEEGKIEGKIEIAKEMKMKGLDSGLIAEITGLPTEEIEGL
jgi:predicted transposase/invertase (TIGR01784 family)